MDVKTTLPISTISFNSVEFLALKLEELRNAKIISFWAFIHHKAEDDEGGKKEHNHVYLLPAKSVLTDDIKIALRELDPNNPDKPLGCINFKKSIFDHWYLYSLHDKRYLALKQQSRRFHYSSDDFYTSDADELLFNVKQIDITSLSPYADMLDAQRNGLTWDDYFRRGTVPIPQIGHFERAWFCLLRASTSRGCDVDVSTGEVYLHDGEE